LTCPRREQLSASDLYNIHHKQSNFEKNLIFKWSYGQVRSPFCRSQGPAPWHSLHSASLENYEGYIRRNWLDPGKIHQLHFNRP
jgi:hypothetical protein